MAKSEYYWKGLVNIYQGDITDESTDAIVNAANEDLARGGGVCGAIHAAAGPGLEQECLDLGGCATGDAIMTDAYDLPCRKVIHAVGPIYGGGAGSEEADLLASCYLESIRLAAQCGLESISFPNISTGTYGYPVDQACRVALAAVKEGLQENPEITQVSLVCFSAGDFEEYERAMAEMK